jgi:hypothetical protein
VIRSRVFASSQSRRGGGRKEEEERAPSIRALDTEKVRFADIREKKKKKMMLVIM